VSEPIYTREQVGELVEAARALPTFPIAAYHRWRDYGDDEATGIMAGYNLCWDRLRSALAPFTREGAQVASARPAPPVSTPEDTGPENAPEGAVRG
jgi:hypothetical protein